METVTLDKMMIKRVSVFLVEKLRHTVNTVTHVDVYRSTHDILHRSH